MTILITVLAVACGAFVVWLGVRTFNRRERWAKRIALGLAAFLIVYPLSYGPAVLLSRRKLMPIVVEDLLAWIYMPVAAVAPFLPEPLKFWFALYIDAWR